MSTITVTKLDHPRYEGDWHDKPLRWKVSGPGEEVQLFSTKAWALQYARIRRQTPDARTAENRFVREAV